MLCKYFIVFLLSFFSAQCSDITINIIDEDGIIKSSHSLGICVQATCALFCSNLGFTGGVCVGDNCTCGYFKQFKDGEMESSHSPTSCNPSTCDQLCRRMGYIGGVCVWGRCSCENLKSNKDPVMNLFEHVENCNPTACDQLCRRLGFPGGACVGDRCKCDNFKQMTYVKDLFKGTGTCDPILCNLLCIRVKHHGGKCMKGHCICYNMIKNNKGIDNSDQKETTVDNDFDKIKEEEHDVILREEPSVAVPESCNTIRCDDMCQKLNYPGGACDGRNCQCF